MTLFTTAACFLASANGVAVPALLVNHYFRTECFIRNVDWVGVVASGAAVCSLLDLLRFIVANLALDRGGLEIIRMRSIQSLGIDCVVAVNAFDPTILYVDLMRKHHFTHSGRKSPEGWYPRAV